MKSDKKRHGARGLSIAKFGSLLRCGTLVEADECCKPNGLGMVNRVASGGYVADGSSVATCGMATCGMAVRLKTAEARGSLRRKQGPCKQACTRASAFRAEERGAQ